MKLKRGTKTVSLQLKKDGKLQNDAVDALSDVFKHTSGAKKPVPPALAELVVQVSDHFGGRTLEIVSGYRPPPGHSNHNSGRAIDFRIESVPVDAIRAFCETLPGTGVGFYPKLKFVHLDVRTHSRRWTDDSSSAKSQSSMKPTPKPAK